MVFKNGELLRFYYEAIDLDELSSPSVDILFSETSDKNQISPDKDEGDLQSVSVVGGGEIYEFCELDIKLNLSKAYTIYIYKIDMLGNEFLISMDAGLTASYLHYDFNDFYSRIDRKITPGTHELSGGGTEEHSPEDWKIVISTDDESNLTGELDLAWVVRVH
ncbi:MAG: hypothetical protein ACTSQ8_09200 [Candidatus Helarchaeota archaeon]